MPTLSRAQELLFTQNGNSNTPSLRRTDGTTDVAVLTGLANPTALAVDAAQATVYWVENGALFRAGLDGSGKDELVGSGVWDIALDRTNARIYWTERNNDVIQRAGLDGSGVEELVSAADGLARPYGIDVDPTNSMLYWTDGTGDDAKIQRANLDGSGMETIVDSSSVALSAPYDVVVAGSAIYWNDWNNKTIARADLNGTNPSVVVDLADRAGEIAVADDKLYWEADDAFSRANLDGSAIEPLREADSPGGLFADATNDFLYWTERDRGRLRRANLDGTEAIDVITSPVVNPRDVAYAPASGWVYWTDTGEDSGFSNVGSIRRIQFGASSPEVLVSGLSGPSGLVLDLPSNQMYWVDEGSGTLSRAALDGSNVTTLVSGLDGPQYLALDRMNGKLYWTDANFGDVVQRANLDGSGVETIATDQNDPSGIGLDVTAGKVYWVDEGNDVIRRANLDGSSPEEVVTSGLSQGADLTVDPDAGELYWTDRSGFGSDLSRANLDGSNAETLLFTNRSQGLFLIHPQASATTPVSGDGTVSFDDTGTDIVFSGSSGSSDVTVQRYGGPPFGTEGISETMVSDYRVVIEAANASFSPGSDTEVRFDTSAFSGIGAPEEVVVYKRASTTGGSFSSVTTSFDDSTGELVVDVSSFSEFVFASDNASDNPLPVELAAFDARVDGDRVHLTWQTAAETNNAEFDIQRRIPARTTGDGNPSSRETDPPVEGWHTVGRLEGAGTTTTSQTYRFTDETLPFSAEQATYRLRQIDLDGGATLSTPITVTLGAPEALALEPPFPNPARGTATLRYALPTAGHVEIALYNVLGQRIATPLRSVQPAGRAERRLDTTGLPSGLYFLRLVTGDQIRMQRLTVVQ